MICSMPKSYPWVMVKSIPVGNFLPGEDDEQSGMEKIYEQRRADLTAFVASLGRGGIAHISRTADIDASYLSRCLYPPSKAGHKNIGDEIAVKLDDKFPQWRGAAAKDKEIYSLKTKTERDRAIDGLMHEVSKLDLVSIAKLTERAKVLAEECEVKQTLTSSA